VETEIMENENKLRKELLEWLETIVISVVCVVLVITFLFRMVGISGASMEETLHGSDRVIISGAFYTPKQGDIVVVSRDYMVEEDGTTPEPIIKRIIATEGQEVYLDFDNNTVYVDGQALDEPYVKGIMGEGQIPIPNPHVVKEGCVFVLGDHRTVSKDSRTADVGDIDCRYILGKAIVRVYPFDQIKVLANG
jgi:signal peptidase I